jgi:hypothetical protein
VTSRQGTGISKTFFTLWQCFFLGLFHLATIQYILYDLHRALYPGERFILPNKTKCENLGILAVAHDNTKNLQTTINR